MPAKNSGDLSAIWELADGKLREELKVPDVAYDLFFGNLHLISLDSQTAVFVCDHKSKQDVLMNRYAENLGNALFQTIGYRPKIRIDVDPSLAEEVPDDGSVVSPLKIAKENLARRARERTGTTFENESSTEERSRGETGRNSVVGEPQPNSANSDSRRMEWESKPAKSGERRLTYNADYTFENFLVGESNLFAQSAALSVADNIGRQVNPLFIYGDSGLGKTHLMYAIANRVLQRDPNTNVIFVKGEDFTNQLIESIRVQTNAAFRDKYRKADMLLIDDIQFIAGKDSTQTEFFHTFDALHEDHKQIVLTSDKPPKEMAGLEERIRSRFESGLIVDIQPPDYELRIAILKSKANQSNLDIPSDVIDFLAQNIQSNIRQIDGVIKKLAAKNFLSGMPITMDMVLTTVPEYLRDTEPVGDLVDRILEAVSKKLNVTTAEMKGQSRKKEIKNARNVSMYVIRNMAHMSLPQIGALFSRDHSTVHSNISMVENQLLTDAAFEAIINEIVKEVKRGG